MKPLDIKAVQQFVNNNIDAFHNKRLETLKKLKLHTLLKAKNPYLFRVSPVSQSVPAKVRMTEFKMYHL